MFEGPKGLLMFKLWFVFDTHKCLRVETGIHQFLEKINQDKIQYQINVFNGFTSEKDKWNFINEARNTRRSNVQIHSLRNCFGDTVTDDLRMANLLNYRFSKLGDYSGVVKKFISSEHLINDEFQLNNDDCTNIEKQKITG